METAQLLGNFGEFAGALAVVGTLVYLAVQVRQSKEALNANTRSLDEDRKMTQADTLRQLTKSWDEILRRATGSREVASILMRGNRNLSDLDEVEQVIYSSLLTPFFNHHLASLQLVDGQFLDDEVTELIDVLLVDVLRDNPGARTWWEAIQFGFPRRLRERINPLLEREGDERIATRLFTATVPPVRQTS
jgi:hypothetical protein